MSITSETLPKSGYTADTPKRYLLNAGALVRNLKWDGATKKWTYDEFGATSGGSKLTLKNNLRQVEVDGVFTTPVGGDMIESSEGTFEVNVIEHTRDSVKMALFAESTESTGTDFPEGYDVITPKQKIGTTDYVENLGYIGTISGSDKPIIIIMSNAICTSGLEIEVKDKSESVVTLTFEARTAAGDVSTTSLPVKILMPKEPEGEA
ncbi:MAG: hypothetical protein LKF42_00385 [Streptococcaceae bacterium]|jgi:hypothetical protein|nr:hypothetical protein [Streptococcaceae bacterium]MCH4176189.1 hypothetical protein [Streptococcaceae bacterium]